MRSLLLMTLLAGLPGVGIGAEYHVSTTGSDSGTGSQSDPWRTLQYAAEQVGAGDRVVVRSGEYAGFHLTKSGLPGAPIEFVAEPGVVVTLPNPVRSDHGINLENASHVVVDGFTVTGMQRAGVRAVGVDGEEFASFVTVRNVQAVDNGYWGIFTGFVNDLVIENNRTSGSTIEHGIYVSNSGDRPVIRDNVIWNNHANGIHMNGDESLGGDGIISGALVSGNVIYNNGLGGGSGINMDGVQDSRIENNLIYNNHASGISLYQIDGGGPSSGNQVVNNTIYQAADARWALNIQNGSTNNTVLNNILISQHAWRGAIDISANSLAGFTSDYNVVISRFTTNGGNSTMSLEAWQTATGHDLHSLVATAPELFVNPSSANGDFQLLDTAPAVDAGTPQLAPMVDLIGVARPAGEGFDIGAYELAAGLAGDFNGDGTVDAADYVAWRRHDGSPDGYETWRLHFDGAMSLEHDAAVPEPVTALIGLACAALITGVRRRIRVRPKVPATLLPTRPDRK